MRKVIALFMVAGIFALSSCAKKEAEHGTADSAATVTATEAPVADTTAAAAVDSTAKKDSAAAPAPAGH